jgi:hypothetical protein
LIVVKMLGGSEMLRGDAMMVALSVVMDQISQRFSSRQISKVLLVSKFKISFES